MGQVESSKATDEEGRVNGAWCRQDGKRRTTRAREDTGVNKTQRDRMVLLDLPLPFHD
jgi:hypothetical protein